MQQDADTLPAIGSMRIGRVGLAVRDLAGTTAFYRDVIGLEVIGADPVVVRLGAGGETFLELIARPDALPDDPREAGLFHTAFLMPTRGDLADWIRDVAARRVPIEGASDHAVSEAIYLSDPEGNGVEVYADRPRASWRWHGAQLHIGTERLDLEALLAARTPHGWRGAPAGMRVGHVHLRVGDVAAAIAFWTETIGLDLTMRTPQAAFLSSGGYHHHIAANTWQSAKAKPRDPRRAGLAYLSLSGDVVPRLLADPWGTEIRSRSTAKG